MKSRITIFGITLLLAIATQTSFAASIEFGAILSGDAEFPTPVATPGSGDAFVVFDDVTGELAWLISFNDLLAPVTVAHIHAVPAGSIDPLAAAGGVAIDIGAANPGTIISGAGKTSGIFAGAEILDFVTDADLIDQLFAGELYFNIHSSAHGGGEIRGQILPASVTIAPVPLPMAAWLMLSGLVGVFTAGRSSRKA